MRNITENIVRFLLFWQSQGEQPKGNMNGAYSLNLHKFACIFIFVKYTVVSVTQNLVTKIGKVLWLTLNNNLRPIHINT